MERVKRVSASGLSGIPREALLEHLANEILERQSPDKTLKVAIDGRCGSGKTTLANELALVIRGSGVDVLRTSIDDFHHPRERRYRQGEYSAIGYYEDAYDYQSVVDHLLGSAPPGSIVLFDGLFLFRPELNQYWDIRILVGVDAATSISRACDRDANVIGPPDVVRRKYEVRYEPAWRIYEDRDDPQGKADLIIDNSDFSHPALAGPLPTSGQSS